jgi:hypothetical protein
MADLLKASPEMTAEYGRWFVNRRAYTRQSDQPHRESGRHYYYRPRRSEGGDLALTRLDIKRHLAGEITIGLYAINPQTQRVKWMAIDADYRAAIEDLLKLQYELGQDGVQAALEQSRRGGHLWILFEKPVLARNARRYIRHLASRLSVQVKGTGLAEGIEIFPKQDLLDGGQFGNAIRAPLGIHRAAGRRYWFYGAAYTLEAQMAYLHSLKRVAEGELTKLIGDLPEERKEERAAAPQFIPDPRRRAFLITEYLDMKTCRRAGRNWVTQCPSCKAAGRDRGKDNLAISVEEPLKYLCWAGCTREQIRAALGAPLPVVSRR